MEAKELLDLIVSEINEQTQSTQNMQSDPFFKGWYAAYLNMRNLLKNKGVTDV